MATESDPRPRRPQSEPRRRQGCAPSGPRRRLSVVSSWILGVLGRPCGPPAYRCETAASVWVVTWLSPMCAFSSYSSCLVTASSPLFIRTPATWVQGPTPLQYDVILTNDISNGPVSHQSRALRSWDNDFNMYLGEHTPTGDHPSSTSTVNAATPIVLLSFSSEGKVFFLFRLIR